MAAYTAIDDPEAYFQTVIYTGNGSADHAITLDGDTNMQPDLVWIKNRDAADAHCLFDAVRGATKLLSSDTGTAESTETDTLDSFTSDGFQVDADVRVNTNAEKYVAWNWKEASGVMDILTYEGNLTAKTVSHSVGAVPGLMIIKNYDTTGGTNWIVYTKALGNTYGMVMSEAEDQDARAHYWNNTTPTSSVFTVGDGTQTNGSGDGASHIAYLFAEIQGYSKFEKYTGNGNADGPFLYTGFRPAWIMIKQTNTNGGHWYIYDNKRGQNELDDHLYPNITSAEATGDNAIDILSNGFKCRSSNGDTNASGGTYIYMAFAHAPFVNSNGVPNNAR